MTILTFSGTTTVYTHILRIYFYKNADIIFFPLCYYMREYVYLRWRFGSSIFSCTSIIIIGAWQPRRGASLALLILRYFFFSAYLCASCPSFTHSHRYIYSRYIKFVRPSTKRIFISRRFARNVFVPFQITHIPYIEQYTRLWWVKFFFLLYLFFKKLILLFSVLTAICATGRTAQFAADKSLSVYTRVRNNNNLGDDICGGFFFIFIF